MSCWTCDCGRRNCDTDECFHPSCPTHNSVNKAEAVEMLDSAGLDGSTVIHDIRIYNGMTYDLDQINFYILTGEKAK